MDRALKKLPYRVFQKRGYFYRGYRIYRHKLKKKWDIFKPYNYFSIVYKFVCDADTLKNACNQIDCFIDPNSIKFIRSLNEKENR